MLLIIYYGYDQAMENFDICQSNCREYPHILS
jgi:hypothetical protein